MQQYPLLQTKLHIPRIRPELVSRPRLIERLNAGLRRKLTLVSAPAGFGKTTLLSEWVAACDRPVAWLSLDEGDNIPSRFWAYLVSALQTFHKDVGEAALAALRSSQPPPIEEILTALINESASIPGQIVLILDDYHLITTQSIHDALTFLLDHLPPQMHLFIAGRSDPPLLLSRLRGRGQLSEVRTAELRFTPDEAADFLKDVMSLTLSADDVDALETRTEGWAVGLQMAGLAMQRLGTERIARFVTAFSGSQRYILDYLTEEVLGQQPESVRAFLLHTAVLPRLTAPLCDAVTGRANGQDMLDRLDAANLFLVPLDDERRWYRYHQLFADLLRKHLSQMQPDLVATLHRRASEWYEQSGLIAEAVSHALQAGDMQRVAGLVGGTGLHMLEHSELRVLERWLDTSVDEELRSEPWLCIARAWMSAFMGQLDAVEPLLHEVEQTAAGVEPSSTRDSLTDIEEQHIRGHVAAVRACVALLQDDRLQTAEHTRDALQLLPVDDAVTRAWAEMVLGLTLHQSNDVEAADQAFSKALTTSRATGDSHVAVLVLCNFAVVQVERGQLRQAVGSLREALQVANVYAVRAGRELPVSAYALSTLGYISVERNELQAAEAHLKESIRLSKDWGEPLRLSGAYLGFAQLCQARGDNQAASEAIRLARKAAGHLSPWLTARVALVEASISLRQGDTATAFHWADAYRDAGHRQLTPHERWEACLLQARIELVRGQIERALDLLEQAAQEARERADNHALIGSLALQAVALKQQGRLDQALTALERALLLAEPEGFVRTFLDEGEPMAALLRILASRGIALDYVSQLLAAFGEAAPSVPLIEPLTERELAVLRLVAAGLSNRDIAAELVLAVGTVKKHTSNIYGKLYVHNRTQAVARARELDLL
jgi:LuxR family maltose regulon positive regulatory protein